MCELLCSVVLCCVVMCCGVTGYIWAGSCDKYRHNRGCQTNSHRHIPSPSSVPVSSSLYSTPDSAAPRPFHPVCLSLCVSFTLSFLVPVPLFIFVSVLYPSFLLLFTAHFLSFLISSSIYVFVILRAYNQVPGHRRAPLVRVK